MRLSALAYPLLVSLVAQLVCAMSFEFSYELERSRHLRIELYTGPCGSCAAMAALSDESAERVEALGWPRGRARVLLMMWLSVSVSVVSVALHVASIYIRLGHGSKRTGPKAFSDP